MSAVAIVLLALAIAADSRRPRLAEVVRSGDDVRALRMLDEGADPNQRDLKGMTPLMWAAVLGHIEVAGRLLDKGAALNAETGGKSGSAADTALTFAGCYWLVGITFAVLWRRRFGIGPFEWAYRWLGG